jgi:hypothetical protein
VLEPFTVEFQEVIIGTKDDVQLPNGVFVLFGDLFNPSDYIFGFLEDKIGVLVKELYHG